MRLITLLAFCLLAATLAANARDPAVKDGKFTVCAFQNFDKCELLTERKLRRYRFNAENKRVLAALRHHTESLSVTVADLEQSFGKSSKIIPHDQPDDVTVAWFHNSVGMNDLNAKCPECGIYVRLTDNLAVSLNYIVDGRFTLAWNRAGAPKMQR